MVTDDVKIITPRGINFDYDIDMVSPHFNRDCVDPDSQKSLKGFENETQSILGNSSFDVNIENYRISPIFPPSKEMNLNNPYMIMQNATSLERKRGHVPKQKLKVVKMTKIESFGAIQTALLTAEPTDRDQNDSTQKLS
jgi:hypothetical protein